MSADLWRLGAALCPKDAHDDLGVAVRHAFSQQHRHFVVNVTAWQVIQKQVDPSLLSFICFALKISYPVILYI